VTVEILRQAAESPEGLTQASIINTARNFDYQASLVREGIPFKTSGEEDGYMVESAQIVQYDSETMFLNDVGDLITEFESS
jgi:branched-chain amino acid transport system substrate-binding protein